MGAKRVGVGEYLIIFSAILIGLAVADLSLSLHRLLRQGREIQWHPIVPLTGFIVLCLILNLWWGLYRNFSQIDQIDFITFLPTVLMLLSLFLLAAAVFPDEKLEKGASLKEFYLDNRVQFWGLFASYLVLVTINIAIGGYQRDWELVTYFQASVPNTIWLLACVGMMITRRMIWHWIVVGLSIVVIAGAWFSAQLTQAAAG
ncbi:MAG: hypothetical protein AAFR64_06000 [Pseudomonadota bacterium]